MTEILVVDDDKHIREVVRFALTQEDYQVIEASNGREGLAALERHNPALIVLDNMMPEMDGVDFCKTVRQSSAVPIIFLSAKDGEIDRIIGLEVGGDDYLTKPFSPRELVARVKARLRTHGGGTQSEASSRAGKGDLTIGALRLDAQNHQAFFQDKELGLTMTEFGLLRTLMSDPGRVFKRAILMGEAYEVSRVVSDRTIDSHIRRLRKKLAEVGIDPIVTLHGIGYKFGTVPD